MDVNNSTPVVLGTFLALLGFGTDSATASGAPAPVAEPTGGDIPFSQLFASGAGAQPTTAPPANEPSMTPVQPQQTATPVEPNVQPNQPPAFELKTSTGTVYKSIDDAVRGIEHKDALLSQMRQQLAQMTGVDPITGQPLQQYGQPQMPQMPQAQPQSQSYLQNPNKYFEDLYQAYQTGNPEAYLAAQQRLIEEKTMAQFAPYLGLLQDSARANAVNKVSSEIQDFQKFYGTQDFQNTVQKYPALAQAVQASEQNVQFAQQLPELYKMAYSLHQAEKLATSIRQQNTAQINPQAPTLRPTATPTTTTPPATFNATSSNLASDSDSRRAFLEAFEKSGKADIPFPKQ